MNINRFTAFILLSVLAASVSAQEKGTADFDYKIGINPVLGMSNPAFQSFFKEGKIAVARLQGVKEDGGLVSLEESPDAFSATAGTEAFARISDRIVFYGKLSYLNFKGQDMGGQVMMAPRFSPVNFLESDETTLGIKIKETYNLVGGLSYEFSPEWSAGVKIDYGCGDLVKRKDPRFRNSLMDLNLTAGVKWSPSEKFSLGADVIFRNLSEQVQGHVYGTTDKDYFVCCDKGGFMGSVEMLEGDYPYLPTSDRRPMKSDFIGGSVQTSFFSGAEFHNDLSFFMRDGKYGQPGSSKPIFFEYGGMEASDRFVTLVRRQSAVHRAGLSLGYSTLHNSENLFKYVTPTGKTTHVEYSGKNDIMERTDIQAEAEYTFYGKTGGYLPGIEAGIDAGFFSRSQTTTIYPSYRNSSLTQIDVQARFGENFETGSCIWSFMARAMFATGSGIAKEDGSFAPGATTSIKSFDSYLYRQFEFDTATRAGAGLELRYTKRFRSSAAAFISVSDSFTTLLADPEYLGGKTRNIACIGIGCNF